MLSVGEDCAAPVGYIHVYYYIVCRCLHFVVDVPPSKPHYFDVQLCVCRNTAYTHTMLSLNAYYISLPNMAHIVM